jgi:hypothetical protein
MLSGIPWTRKAACGLAIALASYLVAAFANASPITQPALAGAPLRTPAVIVVPATGTQSAADGAIRAESPEKRGREFEAVALPHFQSI